MPSKSAKSSKKPLKPLPDNRMQWFEAIEKLRPYVFKIYTPEAMGTGFQIAYTSKSKLCAIATAYHVIAHSYKWGFPIEILHYDSKKSKMLRTSSDSAIFTHPNEDLAFILFNAEEMSIKTDSLDLIPPQKTLKPGVDVGWCGFPAVAPNELCFFNGYVSAYSEMYKGYLVDGVAINGVSGGPAFYTPYKTRELMICGVVTDYIPNRATGTTLPGLSVLRSVEPYQKDLEQLKTFDEAFAAAQKAKEEKIKSGEGIPVPPSSSSPSVPPTHNPSPSK